MLELISLNKTYGGVQALKNINLRLPKGKVVALLGENGAGKSTLVSVLAGLSNPDSGTILVKGDRFEKSQPEYSAKKGIGVVHQQVKLVDSMTVKENLLLSLKAKFWERKTKVLESAVSFAKTYNIEIDLDKVVGELSIGEKQQLEMMTLFQRDCDILIFDETTALLSHREVNRLFTILKSLKKSGKSILFISHKIDEIMEIADEVVIMRRGEITRHLVAEDIVSRNFLARQLFEHGLKSEITRVPMIPRQKLLQVNQLDAGNIKGISLQVRQGEIVGVIGTPGSGQADFVRVLSGLTKPDKGEVTILGQQWQKFFSKRTWEQSLSLIPEDKNLLASCGELDLVDNLLLTTGEGFTSNGILNRKKAAEVVQKLLEEFNIQASGPSALASELSGGNLQKFVIGRTFYSRPKFMVVEQPTQGLDLMATEEIWKLLLKCREQVGVLLFSSNLSEILAIADRIAVMYEGRLVDTFSSEDTQKVAAIYQMMADGTMPTIQK